MEPCPPWTALLRDLWSRIAAHDFDPPVAFSFTARLARDKGWSAPFAHAAIAEYRRFCFLAVAGPAPATPSEEVDEVWHLHLTYTRDYWDVWCGQVLGRPLHHDPTPGGNDAAHRFRQHYADTLAAYEAFFGPPPEPFWPGTNRRFGPRVRFLTYDAERSFVLPRPSALVRR